MPGLSSRPSLAAPCILLYIHIRMAHRISLGEWYEEANNGNEWAIGMSHKSDRIWLWSTIAKSKFLTVFPMLIPACMGYGSVGIDITYKGNEYGVKIYLLMVHTIKAFNGRLKVNLPKTMNGYKGKAVSIHNVTDFLESREPEDLGGFRIELSINATTLEQAYDQVLSTPLLDADFSDFWLDPPEGRETYKMDVKTVSKEGLIGNARWVHQLARQNGFFVGNGSQKPTARHHRVQSDMWSAMGWNTGKRRLIKALDPQAWWWRDTQSEEDPLRDPLAIELEEQYGTRQSGVALLKLIRERHPVRQIPCLLHPGEAQHIYQLRT